MHRDPMCELVDGDGLAEWVGTLDHFLEYPQEPGFDPEVLKAIEVARESGGEVTLSGGACATMVLKIAKPEEP